MIYIAYNKRSCVTGKALFDAMKEALPGLPIRRTIREPKRTPQTLIRWGNSTTDAQGARELNTSEAVANTTDKGRMMRILSDADGVVVPSIIFPEEFSHDDGNRFYRNQHDQIRYRSYAVAGDKYSLSPIDKVMELRIHVFEPDNPNSIVGVYEKIPYEEGTLIYKDDTCQFKRLDQSNREVRRRINGARSMAKNAVAALGLMYGGVDIIKDAEGNWYVLEVNSAPALNTENIQRWTERFQQKLQENG